MAFAKMGMDYAVLLRTAQLLVVTGALSHTDTDEDSSQQSI